jgi:hypothetical protein
MSSEHRPAPQARAGTSAGRGPLRPLQFSKGPTHSVLASLIQDISANRNNRALAEKLHAVDEGSAAGGLVAEVLPLPDAAPAPSPYGPVAPAWVQRHPRMILAWAWFRALRWALRDVWRALITSMGSVR